MKKETEIYTFAVKDSQFSSRWGFSSLPNTAIYKSAKAAGESWLPANPVNKISFAGKPLQFYEKKLPRLDLVVSPSLKL